MSNVREGYDWWPQQGVRQMFLCHSCGAAVADTEQHDEWHAALERLEQIAAASLAYSRKPPMGISDL